MSKKITIIKHSISLKINTQVTIFSKNKREKILIFIPIHLGLTVHSKKIERSATLLIRHHTNSPTQLQKILLTVFSQAILHWHLPSSFFFSVFSFSHCCCINSWAPSLCKLVFKGEFYPWIPNIWYQSQSPPRLIGVFTNCVSDSNTPVISLAVKTFSNTNSLVNNPENSESKSSNNLGRGQCSQ